MKSKLFVVFYLSLISTNSFAYQSELEKFFSLFEAGKVAEAVDSIYSTNKWISAKSDDVLKLKTQFADLTELVGDYYGKVELGVNDIEDRLVHITYMALYERQPVRLEFMFYRAQDDWVINSFSFDDSLIDDLVKAARRKIAGY